MYQSCIKAYQKTGVVTADPKRIVIMCYELAIVKLKNAKSHFELKEFEEKAKSLQTALDVIHELRQALDFKLGGEVAKNLDALYHYMSKRLLDGDLKKDTRAFDEVADMLQALLSAWKEIFFAAPVNTFAPTTFEQRPARGNQPAVQQGWS